MTETLVTSPLFELFESLRKPLSLELEQYFWLLEAMKKGFGCSDLNDLKTTCRLLWLKSVNSEAETQFDIQFETYIKNHQEAELLNRNKPKYPHTETPQETPKKYQGNTDDIQKTIKREPVPNQPIMPQTTSSRFRLPFAYQTDPPIDIKESQRGYILKVSDFPFLERQTRHNWLIFRQSFKNRQTQEIDVETTVKKIAQDGIFLELEYKQQYFNKTELIFFEDVEGSMTPFKPIIEGLVNTVEPRKFAAVNRYYFRNCPRDFVYLQPKGTEIITLENLPLKYQHTVLLIISDAGAARGGYNPERYQMTKILIEKLDPRVKFLFWLNPIPSIRWGQTTAAAIYQLLEGRMFEWSQEGINASIKFAKRA